MKVFSTIFVILCGGFFSFAMTNEDSLVQLNKDDSMNEITKNTIKEPSCEFGGYLEFYNDGFRDGKTKGESDKKWNEHPDVDTEYLSNEKRDCYKKGFRKGYYEANPQPKKSTRYKSNAKKR